MTAQNILDMIEAGDIKGANNAWYEVNSDTHCECVRQYAVILGLTVRRVKRGTSFGASLELDGKTHSASKVLLDSQVFACLSPTTVTMRLEMIRDQLHRELSLSLGGALLAKHNILVTR